MKVVASAGSLPDLLKLLHPSPRLCDSVARYLEEEEGERVLIIADGWDELGESEREEGSFLYQLFFEQFPFVSVVLTSRPSASASLHHLPCIDRFVEVHGFSKEHIVEYIQSEFASDQEKARRLLEQLECNPLVDSICSVPLNCTIVCHLWRTLEEALPTTMTELYTKIILQIILRNIRKIDAYNSVLSLSTFDALPADLQQSWWLLCEFAFQALEKDQLVFALEELKTFFPEGLASDKRILCFGLLQPVESIGFGISFHFLHLTFQEYLAALHLARQSPDKQLDFFQSHKSKSRHEYFKNRFNMVNQFYFGINHFEIPDINANIKFIQQIFKCVAGKYNLDILSLCHCAFEDHGNRICNQLTQYLISHSPFSVYSISGLSRSIIVNFGNPRTAHDCTAVIFAMSNIRESVTTKINFGNCDLRETQIKKLVGKLADAEGKLQITDLNLSGSRLTISGLQALEGAVGGDLFAKLESLNLSRSLTSDADANATWLTTFAEALSAHCPHLGSLDLSDNNLGVPGVTALSRVFPTDYSAYDEPSDHTFRLSFINLRKANIDDEGLIILIKNVVCSLSLIDNDIHSSGVSCLADAVCSGKRKLHSVLHLSDNPLGLEGSVAVARILSSSLCPLLSDVGLSRCGLTTAGINVSGTESLNTISSAAERDIGQQLCQMPQSSSISILDLSGNSFTGEGIHILAGFIHLCQCVTCLTTIGCGITSDDLIWLLNRLNRLKSSSTNLCSKLEIWYLQNNLLDDRGVSALIDHLPSLFPRLTFDPGHIILEPLYGNPVSNEMKKSLEEELRRRREEVS
jgi:Ran GTPase-activating protein (RanGAP) involved in mRNA processing and transport